MKLITCKEVKNYNLTLDKKYELFSESEKRVQIRNDKGNLVWYFKNLFTYEEDKKPLTKEFLLKRISKNYSTNYISVNLSEYDFVYKDIFRYHFKTSANSAGCSCGVGSFSDINQNYTSLKNVTQFKDLLKLNKFTEDDLDFIDIIFIKLQTENFNTITEFKKEGDFQKGRHIIISLKESDFSQYILDVFKKLYPLNSTIINSNSSNIITTFIIDRTVSEQDILRII